MRTLVSQDAKSVLVERHFTETVAVLDLCVLLGAMSLNAVRLPSIPALFTDSTKSRSRIWMNR